MSRRDDIMKSFLRYEEETNHRVEHGIELYRKGFARITVKDKDGNAIPGVKIHARLKKHEFLHGANIFMLDEFDSDEYNQKYREAFANCFNEATVPIYWNTLEPEDGKPRFDKNSPKIYRRPAMDLCVEFCKENNITPKAHCLTYSNFDPDWVDEYDIPALKRRIDRRYRELAERYSEIIPAWEVLNEMLCTDRNNRDKTPFYQSDRFVEDNFEIAHKYFPYNELIINEATHIWEPEQKQFSYNRSDYYQLVERSLRNGARIDCIGMQYHAFTKKDEDETLFAKSLYNPKNIYRILDCYAKLGKPIQITEITIPAYRETAEDYALQAEILERLYRIWFSHPAVEAAIYWNLPDGYAAFAPKGDMSKGENYFRGGLLDFNLNPKPAYDALYNLFHNEWTTVADCETNAEGEAKFKGFFGEYEITVGDIKKTVRTSSKLANDIEIILP
ncbi:MAG: endo-1,4-beta-xylanase [Clostridia bacterium]|nr:endo-1,4-beta-xylanase [Clostridia bacterium]